MGREAWQVTQLRSRCRNLTTGTHSTPRRAAWSEPDRSPGASVTHASGQSGHRRERLRSQLSASGYMTTWIAPAWVRKVTLFRSPRYSPSTWNGSGSSDQTVTASTSWA